MTAYITTLVIPILAIVVPAIIGLAQLRRTPKVKREPEPYVPTSLMVMAVPMRGGDDLPGHGRV